MTLSMIAGPLVGAVIGYCTNYIAVKMLFRPLEPVKIGKHTLPFTPGIIPKGKERLAKAMGKAVGDTLLTKEDVAGTLLTDEVKGQVVDEMVKGITGAPSIKELAGSLMGKDQYKTARTTIADLIENKILDAIKEAGIGNIVVEEGKKALKSKLGGGLFGMFVNDERIASVAEPLKENIERYLDENGPMLIGDLVEKEISSLETVPMGNLLSSMSIEESNLREAIEKAYVNTVEEQIGKMLGQINIAGLVEKKVNDMDVPEVEKLTLSVIKKELDAIVNLGAFIGFAIGMINAFI